MYTTTDFQKALPSSNSHSSSFVVRWISRYGLRSSLSSSFQRPYSSCSSAEEPSSSAALAWIRTMYQSSEIALTTKPLAQKNTPCAQAMVPQ